MIMKIVSAAVGVLVPILANAGIEYETTSANSPSRNPDEDVPDGVGEHRQGGHHA